MSLLCVSSTINADITSTAFFYGQPAPTKLLAHFKQIVVEPENINDLDNLRSNGAKVFAYLSIGEVNLTRSWYSDIPKNWFIGSNNEWGSSIVDLTQEGWHDYLIHQHMAQLWKKGYRGFFLDTLDSYQMVAAESDDRLAQEKALIRLIKRIHQHFPGVKLIFNRGFEILPEVGQYAVALVVESLFQTWDHSSQRYIEVPEPDTTWLLNKLGKVRSKYGFQIIVIDYVDFKRKDLARKTAKKIFDQGFTPYVANPGLDILGVGELEIFPRKVLALYDGQQYPGGFHQAEVHKLIAMPLEYLGYTLDYLDVGSGLPDNQLTGQYAGIVTWFNNDTLLKPNSYKDWLLRQIDSGMKIAIFGKLGFNADNTFLQRLGVNSVSNIKGPLKIGLSTDIIGYEAAPYPKLRTLTAWKAIDNRIENHLSLIDNEKQDLVAVFTGYWGGAALNPYVIENGYMGNHRWIINPFQFLSKALDLPDIPVPDVTTENGRRLLLIQIDGDGAGIRAEIPETPLAIKVIKDDFLVKYQLPSTVSIIEGEMAKGYSSELTEIESLARDIFKLKNVEIASHSYSHPSSWFQKSIVDTRGDDYYLAVKDYEFDLNREINGSVGYINNKLAPENKRTQVFVWTGDAIAGRDALEMSYSLGLENINGGGATITKDVQTITHVPPLGYGINKQYQVYAPIASDHVYTNSWQGPFYGFDRVIETLQLTNSPFRLKPLHIHYHFYSGSKKASIDALKSVYDWSIKQESMPVWVSEYARKVNEFQNITLSQRLDGAWNIRGASFLRTIRLPKVMEWPDLGRSRGVVGVRKLDQGRYVHLLPEQDEVLLYTSSKPPLSSFLLHSNGVVRDWAWAKETVQFNMHAHVPLELVVASSKKECFIRWANGRLNGQQQNQSWKFVFPTSGSGKAELICI